MQEEREIGIVSPDFPFGDINALTDKLLKCARDKAKLIQMGRQAKEHIKNYSMENTVKGTMEAVRCILKRGGKV